MKKQVKHFPILKMVTFSMSILLFTLISQNNAMAAEPQVVTAPYHTVGLKSDGTVVASGYTSYGVLNVGDWTGIEQVAAATR